MHNLNYDSANAEEINDIMIPTQKLRYVAKFLLISLFVCGCAVGLPLLTFAIQRPFISYDPQLPFGGLGPLYYPMTLTFMALFGFILGTVSAVSFNLWHKKNYRQSSVMSLWFGGLFTIFFILGCIDGTAKAAIDDSRGVHTDFMGVIPLLWSAGIFIWGFMTYSNHPKSSE